MLLKLRTACSNMIYSLINKLDYTISFVNRKYPKASNSDARFDGLGLNIYSTSS
jgi:hypothetical protein